MKLIIRIPFLLAYRIFWRLARPLFWRGGPDKANERIMRVLAYCDDHKWVDPILKFIHWIAW